MKSNRYIEKEKKDWKTILMASLAIGWAFCLIYWIIQGEYYLPAFLGFQVAWMAGLAVWVLDGYEAGVEKKYIQVEEDGNVN